MSSRPSENSDHISSDRSEYVINKECLQRFRIFFHCCSLARCVTLHTKLLSNKEKVRKCFSIVFTVRLLEPKSDLGNFFL